MALFPITENSTFFSNKMAHQSKALKAAIIGCGYVGSSIARRLQQLGYVVAGSSTTHEGASKLISEKIVDTAAIINNRTTPSELIQFIHQSDLLCITVAPKRPLVKDAYSSTYTQTALSLLKALTQDPASAPQHIIYTSSCSIYGNCSGRTVDETSHPIIENDFQRILFETESIILSLPHIHKKSVFRLGEIVDDDERSLLEKLRKRAHNLFPGDGSSVSNLTHIDDILHAVEASLTSDLLLGLFNLVGDIHLPRKELYHIQARSLNIPPPIWDGHAIPSHHSGSKRVSTEKIRNSGYVFQRPLYPFFEGMGEEWKRE